jgi:proteasome lid subunit RPN8/RPN11
MQCMLDGVRGCDLTMWRELPPDLQATPLAALFRRSSFIVAAQVLQLLRDSNAVLITQSCLEDILDHLRRRNTELGGLLLGTAYVPRELGASTKGCLTVADRVIESEQCRSSSVSLAMDTDVWDRARRLLGPSTHVVGWYHSHPNLGAFFRGTDRRTQRAFFSQPYSVGLVVDPVRNEQAWFSGADSAPLPAERVRVIT